MALCSRMTVDAQEYRYELGAMAGASMYLGDANEVGYLRGWHPAGGLIFRNNLNFRWALRADLLAGQLSGDTRDEQNAFPNQAQISFKRTWFGLNGKVEFNFLPYSDKYAYLNTSRLAPYLVTGLGIVVAPGDNRNFAGLQFPLGAGVKYKLKNRLNIGIEYTVYRLFGDALDAPTQSGFNLNNPYQVKQGWLKNNDWYNTLLLSITWEFGLRDGRCTTD